MFFFKMSGIVSFQFAQDSIQNDTLIESNWLPLGSKRSAFPDLKIFACHMNRREGNHLAWLLFRLLFLWAVPWGTQSSSLSLSCTAICSELLEISWHKLLPHWAVAWLRGFHLESGALTNNCRQFSRDRFFTVALQILPVPVPDHCMSGEANLRSCTAAARF